MRDCYRPGYIRVSTKEQELGLESQFQQLIDYGVKKEDIFVDRGVSGTSNFHSERMEALMLAVRGDREKHNRKIEVVVAKLDRWGRDPEETIALLKELHVSGACLTSLGENIHMVNPDSGTGMLIVRIMLAVAAQERDRIAERTRDSLVAVRARGIPLGPPPKLTSNDVAWIRDKHEKEKWGAKRIAKALPAARNVEVSKYTVQRVLGQVSRATPYVPKDNHKYVARAGAAAEKRAKAAARVRPGYDPEVAAAEAQARLLAADARDAEEAGMD
ncbi:recombinase family protein [Microbacterium sp. W4I20]|uniref:recombinase family protein n=1 Tax=Microbacterium sp. W4I20 TaxID=3042262 RepID=UPI00278A2F62|nr:recombinase family protein [Microbacterium sp. W4I20]MDQ0726052.1 DNA invertase Pin-like site-specific DNA recombinase [Microbacterium sp. W4I20]